MCNIVALGIPDNVKHKLDQFFASVSIDALDRDRSLLSKYVNVVSSDIGTDPGLPEETVAAIKEALIEYRTKTYKRKHIKAYEVFVNVACDRIAKYAPRNISDLQALRCLDELQIEQFGEDITTIINNVLEKHSILTL